MLDRSVESVTHVLMQASIYNHVIDMSLIHDTLKLASEEAESLNKSHCSNKKKKMKTSQKYGEGATAIFHKLNKTEMINLVRA
jgi:hypothetical protein